MATKKTTTPTIDAIETVVTKAQEQYLAALEQGQALALDGYKTVLEGAAKLNVPSIPGLADMYTLRNTIFEQMYDFGIAVLESQRTFTKTVLETAAKSQS